jgi:hypothetical protein
MDESRFFFEKEIHHIYHQLRQNARVLFNLYAEHDTCNIDDQENWRRLADELTEQVIKLKEIHRELPAKFENALAFKKIRGP